MGPNRAYLLTRDLMRLAQNDRPTFRELVGYVHRNLDPDRQKLLEGITSHRQMVRALVRAYARERSGGTPTDYREVRSVARATCTPRERALWDAMEAGESVEVNEELCDLGDKLTSTRELADRFKALELDLRRSPYETEKLENEPALPLSEELSLELAESLAWGEPLLHPLIDGESPDRVVAWARALRRMSRPQLEQFFRENPFVNNGPPPEGRGLRLVTAREIDEAMLRGFAPPGTPLTVRDLDAMVVELTAQRARSGHKPSSLERLDDVLGKLAALRPRLLEIEADWEARRRFTRWEIGLAVGRGYVSTGIHVGFSHRADGDRDAVVTPYLSHLYGKLGQQVRQSESGWLRRTTFWALSPLPWILAERRTTGDGVRVGPPGYFSVLLSPGQFGGFFLVRIPLTRVLVMVGYYRGSPSLPELAPITQLAKFLDERSALLRYWISSAAPIQRAAAQVRRPIVRATPSRDHFEF